MPATSVTSQIQLTMHMSADGQGWSEKLYLPQANLTAAMAPAARLVRFRLNCLPKAAQLDWAKVNIIGAPRDARSVLTGYPVDGLFVPDPGTSIPTFTPNLATDAMRIRLETEDGPWSTRFMHGVPDSLIEADVLTETIELVTTPPADPTVIDPTAVAFHTLVAQYLAAVRVETKFFRVRMAGSTKIKEVFDIAATIFRGVEFKKCGRPFGQRRGRANPR